MMPDFSGLRKDQNLLAALHEEAARLRGKAANLNNASCWDTTGVKRENQLRALYVDLAERVERAIREVAGDAPGTRFTF
jgi:hypothetical protein